jgi:hypothetical protein
MPATKRKPRSRPRPAPATRDGGSASVVKLGAKKCRPFLLQVMVVSPESGYKFEVLVERACTPENDPVWKLVFDLYKKNRQGEHEQIVHVSFRAGTPEENQGIQRVAAEGVSSRQAELLVGPVFEAAKELEGVSTPSQEQKDAIRREMSHVATVET